MNLLAAAGLPIINFDVDGVLGDFITPCLDEVEVTTGLRFTPDQITDWDIMKSVGVSPDDAKAIYKAMERPGLCMSLPVYPGAKEALEQLRKIARVHAITAPFGGDHWMHERDRWLVEKLGFDKHHVMHVRSELKSLVYADFFVEDKTSTLVSWRAFQKRGTPILFMRKYNENDGWDGVHVDNFPDLVAFVTARLAMSDR